MRTARIFEKKCEPEDTKDNLFNDDQDQSQIENIEDFTGKYEELKLSDDNTTDPLAVIKFSKNSDLMNLEQTSDMVEGPEEKFDNLEQNAKDTPFDEKEQKLLKIMMKQNQSMKGSLSALLVTNASPKEVC